MNQDSKVKHSFTASERLKHRKLIETLFRNGEAFSVFPFKVVYSLSEKSSSDSVLIKMGCAVPKRNKKHAVDRNRIKRSLKEAWRIQKHQLFNDIPKDKELHLFFIFIGKDMPDFKLSASIVSKAINRLQTIISKKIS